MKTILFLTLAVTLTACPRSSQNEAQMISTTRGKALYETHCAPCHGDSGMGDGALARLQWPRPRDFTAGIFKYRATRGPIPSDTDLLQTMKIGIPGALLVLGVLLWMVQTLRRRAGQFGDEFWELLGRTTQAAWLGCLVGFAFIPVMQAFQLMTCLWVAAGLSVVTLHQDTSVVGAT